MAFSLVKIVAKPRLNKYIQYLLQGFFHKCEKNHEFSETNPVSMPVCCGFEKMGFIRDFERSKFIMKNQTIFVYLDHRKYPKEISRLLLL